MDRGLVDGGKGIAPWLRQIPQPLTLTLSVELLDRLVPRTIEGQRVRGIKEQLDRVRAYRGILHVAADPIGSGLEGGDRLTGARGAGEGEVVLEEVVVPVDMRDR